MFRSLFQDHLQGRPSLLVHLPRFSCTLRHLSVLVCGRMPSICMCIQCTSKFLTAPSQKKKFSYPDTGRLLISATNTLQSAFSGLVVSMLASDTQVRGFKPG
jgi:hypothetical protein